MGDIRTASLLRPARPQTLESRLREALDDEQFVMHYQPKVDLASGTVCGLEALMRWQDPRRGLVAPGAFISALENSDLIVEVGQWAIRHVLSQRLAWHIGGLRPPPVTVNISAAQLRHPGLVSTICDSLEAVGVGAPGLELDLAESAALVDGEAHREKLRALGDRGVSIAIDDCGTREESMAHLAQLPVNELKVDRPHIARASDPDGAAAVASLISFAHERNLTVVAEGVETIAQRDLLRGLGCDRMQGHLVSRPMPASEIARLLHRSEIAKESSLISNDYVSAWQSGRVQGQDCC